jgi:hypothetical protein
MLAYTPRVSGGCKHKKDQGVPWLFNSSIYNVVLLRVLWGWADPWALVVAHPWVFALVERCNWRIRVLIP